AYFNINGFSKLNKEAGYAAGDEVISGIANVLTSTLDKSYSIARMKSDEFLVIIQDLYEQSEIEAAVGNIKTAIEAPNALSKRVKGVKVSIGVASYPFSGDDVDSLLKAAKSAATKAKVAGGSQIVYDKSFSDLAGG
ncbi:MAG: GGDEF domain-containing protein, partial [Alphaproteobacteria bacterium]|nr:GGDEF domain-containing protein [Alphaproteobacteria bacterium]